MKVWKNGLVVLNQEHILKTLQLTVHLYASKKLQDGSEEWYMLRGKELLDNPKMECWELLNSVNEIALFKTMKGFGVGDDDEKIGIVKDNGDFDEALNHVILIVVIITIITL